MTDRQIACWPDRRSGVPNSWNHRVEPAKIFTWSVVWLAPVPRSSCGRSAVSRIIGT
jgi:hypothetical protein